ncbi:hypothetical protein GXW82_44425 [Streptacidiphilus sp. 4-A2]|nr:hypothetical protein [Streptacidiphilus sp. 4-A2]
MASRHLQVTWRDTRTGAEHSHDVYVKPGSEDLIPLTLAAAELRGEPDVHRVQVLTVTELQS